MAPKTPERTILLVSADPALKRDLGDNLSLQGYRLLHARGSADALGMLNREQVDLVLLDLEKLAAQEMDIVRYARSRSGALETVVLTTAREIEDARNAVRAGAAFYLLKPVAFRDLKQVLDKLALRMESDLARQNLEQQVLHDLMAGSPAMEKVLALSTKIAPTDSTVLLGGESGTGKEFFARIVYRMSRRHDGPFVPVNCGAIPDTLLESELFGHTKGSFTGADRERMGVVEEAHMGTLFLDEVADLSPAAQVKLLRFLQDRTFKRVGENVTRTVDVRVIAATNRNLTTLVSEGRFREDLFYRLNVFYLHLPPLRERRETIPALVKLFVHRFNQAMGKQVSKISKDAEAALAGYDFPGNVRELENVVEHAVVLAEGGEIRKQDLPEFMFGRQLMLPAPRPRRATQERFLTLEELERGHIEDALARFSRNYTEVARKLGISRSTLWRKLKAYRLAEEPAGEDQP
jgi:DNA-binding NtrC family response regulator